MAKRVPTITVCQGLPASGKSTYAKQLSHDTGAIRLNLDDVRNMMGFGQGSGKWTKNLEKVAVQSLVRSLVAAVELKHDVILDNTHMAKSLPQLYKTVLARHVVRFQVKSFLDVPESVCIERDAKREGSAQVGQAVIRRLAGNLHEATKGGWALTTGWLNEPIGFEPGPWPVTPQPYLAVPGTPKAILVDLDGTLFLMRGRTPHEYKRVEEDQTNPSVVEMVRLYKDAGYVILLASGRPETHSGFDVRAATVRALTKAGIPFDHLWMRPGGDFRKDTVVKLELFDNYIRDWFDVRVCLDDRNSVVDQYRNDLELPTWQTADGAF